MILGAKPCCFIPVSEDALFLFFFFFCVLSRSQSEKQFIGANSCAARLTGVDQFNGFPQALERHWK